MYKCSQPYEIIVVDDKNINFEFEVKTVKQSQ